jgi:hypothetical protein
MSLPDARFYYVELPDYCGKICQILAFTISLYCPKRRRRHDHSVRISEYQTKTLFLTPFSKRA